MKLKSIQSVKNLEGKKVIVRVDFNVPIKNGLIKDDFRIKEGMTTIRCILKQKGSVIILNHLGRPKGKTVPELSNKPVAARLEKLLGQKVIFVEDIIGEAAKNAVKNLKSGEVLMLENIRFHEKEEEDSHRFGRSLALLGDIYVNDAFAVCHRKASSVSAITEYLPSYAGLLLEKEVFNLSKVLESAVKPKIAIIGGAKLETKVKVIENLMKKMDFVLIGGAIANNFLKARGLEVGKSLVDNGYLALAKKMLKKNLVIPKDVVVSTEISETSPVKIKSAGEVYSSDIILDIGPKTVEEFAGLIAKSKLIVWNGPMGYFEISKFRAASVNIAKAVAGSQSEAVVGGGETVQLIEELELKDKFAFVSTAGGAMLEFLEGKILPGIRPLVQI